MHSNRTAGVWVQKSMAKTPIWINPDITKTERDVRFPLRLRKRHARKENEEKKIADQNEAGHVSNDGSAIKALQNENRLDIDNANIDKNSNSAVADELTAKDTSSFISASPDIAEKQDCKII